MAVGGTSFISEKLSKKAEEYPTVGTITNTSKQALNYTSGAVCDATSVFLIPY